MKLFPRVKMNQIMLGKKKNFFINYNFIFFSWKAKTLSKYQALINQRSTPR